ncbi:MAG: 6-bladed beta-propeller [Candidatus Nitrosotenuis sp.]
MQPHSISIQKLKTASRFNDIFERRREIQLETEKGNVIGSIKQFINYNEMLYILDDISRGVYIFAESGKFIKQLGKIGQGPGEYNSPSYIGLDQDQNIIVLNHRPVKLIYYKNNGEYLKELNLYSLGIIASRFLIDERGCVYLYTLNPDFKHVSKGKKVVVIDKSFRVLYTLGSEEPTLEKLLINGGTIKLDPRGNLWIGRVFDLGIEIYDSKGNYLKTILEHNKYLPSPITPKEFSDYNKNGGLREHMKKLSSLTSIVDVFFVDGIAVLATAGLGKYYLTFFDLDGNLVKDKLVIDPQNLVDLGGPILGSLGDEIYSIEEMDAPSPEKILNPKIVVYGIKSND